MKNLIGKYEFTLDNKGRLNIPAKLRKDFPESGSNDVVVTSFNCDDHLNIYPADIYDAKLNKIRVEAKLKNKNHQRLMAYIGSVSTRLTIDLQGRVVIPADMLEEMKIGNDVALIGAIDRIELWNREQFNDSQLSKKEVEQMMNDLEDMDI